MTVANKPGHRGEHEATVKTIARGMPGDPGVTVVTNARVYYTTRGAAGASGARHSLRPLMFRGRESKQNSGAMRGEIARFCLQMIGCLKSESVAAPPRHCEERKRRSNPFFVCGPMDCFRLRSSSYGGHVASLAMTGRVGGQRRPFAPCPPCQRKSRWWARLRFAHPQPSAPRPEKS